MVKNVDRYKNFVSKKRIKLNLELNLMFAISNYNITRFFVFS